MERHYAAHELSEPATNVAGSRKLSMIGEPKASPWDTMETEGRGPTQLGGLPSQLHQENEVQGAF